MPARAPSPTERRTRRKTGRHASVRSLRTFLEQPARPAGTLTYHELHGLLFAVVSAPELVRPSEWLPLIFNEQEARYSTLEEANTILGQIMTLYNDINAATLKERVVLPGDCHLRPQVLDNLENSAPLACWSRGFVLGHEWLTSWSKNPEPRIPTIAPTAQRVVGRDPQLAHADHAAFCSTTR